MVPPCVVVVDDEVLIQMLLQTDLTDAGFTVFIEGSMENALARLASGACECHALVTDINLGDGQSGWDIARRARELNPAMPVVYMTGDSAHEWPVQGVPGSVLVSKPFATVQIINAVAQLLTDTSSAAATPTA